MSEDKKKRTTTRKAVSQMKYDGVSYQIVDPRNGPVALVWHRGKPLAKADNKTVDVKNLCWFKVIKSPLEYTDPLNTKGKTRTASPTYARALRTAGKSDGKPSEYRAITKQQMRILYGEEVPADADNQIVTLCTGDTVQLYDKSVRRFIAEDSAKKKKRKRKKSPAVNAEQPPKKSPARQMTAKEKKMERAQLLAQLAALE